MFKNINETKNFPAPSREWKDSVYSYNKNVIITAPHKDSMANTIVSMALHSRLHSKINTKSIRMRDLIQKVSTRQLIVSRPDIKQNSDKAIVTAYIYDREKVMYVRRLYFIKDSLYKSAINLINIKKLNGNRNIKKFNANRNIAFLYLPIINNNNSLDINNIVKNDQRNTMQARQKSSATTNKFIINSGLSLTKLRSKYIRSVKKFNPFMKMRVRLKRLKLKKLSYKYRINNKLLIRVIYKSLLNKKSILNNLFMYKFLKWIMSYFSITVTYVRKNKRLNIIGINNKLRTIRLKNNVLILANNINNINNSKKIKNINNIKKKTYNINNYMKIFKLPKTVSLLQMRIINKILLTNIRVMMTHYISDNVRVNNSMRKVFNLYRNKYLMRHARFFLRKQKLALGYLIKLYNNKLKYNNLIYGFKYLLGNIFNKNIKLNLVNLKYLHLNSDTLSEAVTTKLRKKYNRLLPTLKKALRLIKLPKIIPHSPDIQNIVKFTAFDWSTNDNSTKVGYSTKVNNMLDNLLFSMFPNKVNYDKHELAHNVLYSIKHKWVRGARLEAKGRLTKRFTASRSLFKYRFKGSLRNLEHLKKPNYTKEQVSVIMLRNSIKTNVQHTFASSYKRIGVFGIKGWISGY